MPALLLVEDSVEKRLSFSRTCQEANEDDGGNDFCHGASSSMRHILLQNQIKAVAIYTVDRLDHCRFWRMHLFWGPVGFPRNVK